MSVEDEKMTKRGHHSPIHPPIRAAPCLIPLGPKRAPAKEKKVVSANFLGKKTKDEARRRCQNSPGRYVVAVSKLWRKKVSKVGW